MIHYLYPMAQPTHPALVLEGYGVLQLLQPTISFQLLELPMMVVDLGTHGYGTRCFGHYLLQTCDCQRYLLSEISHLEST